MIFYLLCRRRYSIHSFNCFFESFSIVRTASRRSVLKIALFAWTAAVAGCGGGSVASNNSPPPVGNPPSPPPPPPSPSPPPPPPPPAPPPSPPPPPAPPAWVIAPYPSFTVGSNQSFDLAATLPTGIRRGGLFSIDPASAGLPQGMVLTSAGVLSVGTATIGTVVGVIFSYVEP